MCTVTWLLQENGYQIFFNRDELKTRQTAHPPVIEELHGVKYIAPTDADAGGSWLGVNEYGLSIGILNYYHAKAVRVDGAKQYISRGLLLKSLLDSANQEIVFSRLNQGNLHRYQPFILVIWEPGKSVAACTWDNSGDFVQIEKNAVFPLTSSSFNSGQVIKDRLKRFGNFSTGQELDAQFLREFHKSHLPEAGPYSVCMHREDAQTVSFSEISVTPATVEFRYIPGSPCQNSFLPPLLLPRIAQQKTYGRPDHT